MVELTGVEPVTSRLPVLRAPNCATAPHEEGSRLPGQRILTKDSDQFKGRTAFAGIFFGFSGIVCSVMAFMTRSEDRAVDLFCVDTGESPRYY